MRKAATRLSSYIELNAPFLKFSLLEKGQMESMKSINLKVKILLSPEVQKIMNEKCYIDERVINL